MAYTPGIAPRLLVLYVASLAVCLTAVTTMAFDGNMDAARAYDEGARALLTQDSDSALDAFRRAAEIDTSLTVAHYELGLLWASRSRWREAEARFKDASRPGFADAYSRLGEVRLRGLANAESAVEALEEAVAIDAHHAAAHRILGIAYRRIGKGADAIAALETAIGIDPTNADARYELGSALLGLRSFQEASEQLQILVNSDPLHAQAHLSLGTALIRIGQAERGREMLEAHHVLQEQVEEIDRIRRALARDEGDTESWYRLGRVRMNRREWTEAARALARCIALAGNDPRGYEALGYVYGQLGAHDQALGVYAEIMRMRPGVAAYHNGLGVLLLRMRRIEEAVAQFREAIALDGHEPGYQLNLAAAYRQGGNEKRAGEAYAAYQAMKATQE
jgi:tetratricopeptide (TPR) repeat protein